MENHKKNVLLLTVECLRADHMHFLGYSRWTTPILDKLSAKSLTFSNAMVTFPWTPASFKSLLTSRYPLMDGGIVSIPKGIKTLPQVLKEHNYHTGAFIPEGWLSKLFNYDRGFEDFHSGIRRGGKRLAKIENSVKGLFNKQEQGAAKEQKRKAQGRLQETFRHYKDFIKQIYPPNARFATAKAKSWIRDNQDDPFFLLLHYKDPHEPCYPGLKASLKHGIDSIRVNMRSMMCHATRKPGKIDLSERDIQMLIDLYDEEIRIVDRSIGDLLNTLRELGLLDDTYVIITGDHGQQFMEHGEFGHGLELYNEVLNVPLLIFGPNIKRERVDTPVSLIDLPPTVLDFLDYEENNFLGISLLDKEERQIKARSGIICEEARERRNEYSIKGGKVKCGIDKKKIAVITPSWKYIYKNDGEDELYNLKEDPKEENNRYSEKPAILSALRGRVQEHIDLLEESMGKRALKERIRGIKRRLE